MAKKIQEWKEIVVKKGDHDDDDSYEEVYPGDYFPKVLQDWYRRQNTAARKHRASD